MSAEPNRWRGFVLGVAGGVVGTIAMGGYWRAATALAGKDPRAETRQDGSHALDAISLVGTHHAPDESSTAAVGRLAYATLAGKPARTAETRATLSYLVHYGYGATQGGFFGALTVDRDGQAGRDGAIFGTGLWLLGDELAMSLLGLADGPGKYPLGQHLHRWGAHLVYGVTTAVTTKLLRWLV